MYKKRILAIILTASLIVPSTVLAKGKNDQPKNNQPQKTEQTQKQNNEQKRQEKQQEISEFKTEIKQKHEQMASLRKQSQDLRKQISQKKDQLETILEQLKSGEKTLPEDQLNALLTLADQLKQDAVSVKNTAEIKKEDTEVKTDIDKKDFNNALNALDKVIAKLQQRVNALNKLNSDLDAALAIANTAAAPAPAAATDTTATDTNATDSGSAATTTP